MRRTGELLGLAVLSVAAAIGPAAAQVPPNEFVNFEGAQTNPIRLSSDGTRLFALNTPDTRVSVFDISNPSSPALIVEIPAQGWLFSAVIIFLGNTGLLLFGLPFLTAKVSLFNALGWWLESSGQIFNWLARRFE